MVKFVPNPNFEAQLKRDLDRKAQAVIDHVAKSHAGQPAAGIGSELDAGLRRQGINLPASTLGEWAEVIARGDELKADLHIV